MWRTICTCGLFIGLASSLPLLTSCAGGAGAGTGLPDAYVDPPTGSDGLDQGSDIPVGEADQVLRAGDVPEPELFDASIYFADANVALTEAAAQGDGAIRVRIGHGYLPPEPLDDAAPSGDFLHLSLSSRDTGNDPLQAPHDLVFLIDNSGSMLHREYEFAPERASLAHLGARVMLRSLTGADRAAVIAFADTPRVLEPLQSALQLNDLLGAVDSLDPGGRTDLLAAIRQGIAECDRVGPREDGGGRRLIVLTDDPVDQPGEADDLLAYLRTQADRDIYISIISIVQGMPPEVIESIRSIRGANFQLVTNRDEVQEVCGSDFLYWTHPAFFDVIVRLALAENVSFVDAHGIDAGGVDPLIHLPTAFPTRAGVGSGGSILVQLDTAALADDVSRLGQLQLAWTEPDGTQGGYTFPVDRLATIGDGVDAGESATVQAMGIAQLAASMQAVAVACADQRAAMGDPDPTYYLVNDPPLAAALDQLDAVLNRTDSRNPATESAYYHARRLWAVLYARTWEPRRVYAH